MDSTSDLRLTGRKRGTHTIRIVDDRAIVALLRDQDPAGLAAAYDAYGQRLYAFCPALLRQGDEKLRRLAHQGP